MLDAIILNYMQISDTSSLCTGSGGVGGQCYTTAMLHYYIDKHHPKQIQTPTSDVIHLVLVLLIFFFFQKFASFRLGVCFGFLQDTLGKKNPKRFLLKCAILKNSCCRSSWGGLPGFQGYYPSFGHRRK